MILANADVIMKNRGRLHQRPFYYVLQHAATESEEKKEMGNPEET
jgi:hypothetical protein